MCVFEFELFWLYLSVLECIWVYTYTYTHILSNTLTLTYTQIYSNTLIYNDINSNTLQYTHNIHLQFILNDLLKMSSGSTVLDMDPEIMNAYNFNFANPKLLFKNIGNYAATSTYIHVLSTSQRSSAGIYVNV